MIQENKVIATLTEASTPATPTFDRRMFMRAGAAFGLGIAAAGTLVSLGAAAQEDAATPAGDANATAAIVTAANDFLATLSDDEKSAMVFDWSNIEQKTRWSNLPEGAFKRAGLMWGNLSEAQQAAWLPVLQATLSAEGYQRVLAAWNADELLANEGGGGGRGLIFGKAYYWMAFIGAPSETDPWQLQFGGHHITINATIVGPNISMTPSFIGVQPGTYTDESGATIRPLGDIADDAFALINAFDAEQQATAVLGTSYVDLVLGPGQDGKTIQAEGLSAAEMTDEQKATFLKLIGHYTGLVNDVSAATRMDEIEADLDQTTFAWYGPTAQGSAAYFRVTGPTIVIEYSPQEMGGDPANHIHGIYRDPSNDYGARFVS